MEPTTLLAILIAQFTRFSQGDPWDCAKECLRINISDPHNPCAPVYDSAGCHCDFLERAKSNDLYLHRSNTKVEIYPDNSLHMFCHDSTCFRNDACRIHVWYRQEVNQSQNGNYELPAYNDCCTLPQGYVDDAKIVYMPY